MESFFINTGIYIISNNVLSVIDYNKYLDMPTFINKYTTLNSLKCNIFPVHEYWLDIGQIEHLKKANLDINKY